MLDGGALSRGATGPAAVDTARRGVARHWGSPLLRRILLVNALPLALLVAALLYLDQYQNALIEAEVLALPWATVVAGPAWFTRACRGVPAEVLRGGVGDDVGAVLDRPQQVRGGQRVVHDQRHAGLVGGVGDGAGPAFG